MVPRSTWFQSGVDSRTSQRDVGELLFKRNKFTVALGEFATMGGRENTSIFDDNDTNPWVNALVLRHALPRFLDGEASKSPIIALGGRG